jgi:hypothetical protein
MVKIYKLETTEYKMEEGDGIGVNVIFLKSPTNLKTKFLQYYYGN